MTALKLTNRCGGAADHSQRRIFVSLLAAAATAAALAGCHGSDPTAQQEQHDTSSYSVPGHVRALVVSAHVADVRVTGGKTVAIAVTQHVAFHGAKPTISRRFAGGTLTLSSHCAANTACSISYDITVPRSTTVRVADDVGTVRLSALVGQVTATVDAGQIDLSSLSGPVDATIRAGSIMGQHVSSARASLRVSTGEVDVAFSAAPAAVSATTDVGAIILRVPSSVSYHVVTSAVVGHIGVSITQNTAAPRTITASTTIGAITIEPTP
jgi:DUF4097 and DUF4098 domain-containing protein YvlB